MIQLWNYEKISLGSLKQVRNSHSKRAIGVRVIAVSLHMVAKCSDRLIQYLSLASLFGFVHFGLCSIQHRETQRIYSLHERKWAFGHVRTVCNDQISACACTHYCLHFSYLFTCLSNCSIYQKTAKVLVSWARMLWTIPYGRQCTCAPSEDI